ncbi:hypothetical protein [Halalkalicoccus jeotgali]|nr:hypothetical protein [Halalkalicoccus jeotgali]
MADPIKPRWIAVGATESIVWTLLFDHDVGGIRRSYRRRVAAIVLLYPYYRLRYRRDTTWSIGVGRSVGTIVYRLKYGLLEDPPGA